MTIANIGATPQRVGIAGQDIGVFQPGGSVIVEPFRRAEAVGQAGGRFTFTVESVDLASPPESSTARPLTIAVYPAGSLGPSGGFAGTATPVGAGTPAAAGSIGEARR